MNKPTIRYIVDTVSKANPQRSLRNVNRRLNKMVEEMGEIAEAYLNSTSTTNGKGKSWKDVQEEAVDCLIVAIDIALTDIYGDIPVSSPFDGIPHLVEHVGLNEQDYDNIIRLLGTDLFNYWTNYKISEIYLKLAKWAASRALTIKMEKCLWKEKESQKAFNN